MWNKKLFLAEAFLTQSWVQLKQSAPTLSHPSSSAIARSYGLKENHVVHLTNSIWIGGEGWLGEDIEREHELVEVRQRYLS